MTKYCPKCGFEVKDKDNFCKKCGHSFTGKKPERFQINSGIVALIGYILAFIFPIFAFIVAVFLITRKELRSKLHGVMIIILALLLTLIYRFFLT